MNAIYLEFEGKITSTCSKDPYYRPQMSNKLKGQSMGLKRGKRDGSVGHSSTTLLMEPIDCTLLCHCCIPPWYAISM